MDMRKKKSSFLIICLALLIFTSACGSDRSTALSTSDSKNTIVAETIDKSTIEDSAAPKVAGPSKAAEPSDAETAEEQNAKESEKEPVTEPGNTPEPDAVTGSVSENATDTTSLIILTDVPETTVLSNPIPNYTGDSSIVHLSTDAARHQHYKTSQILNPLPL